MRYIIFLTDGYIGNETEILSELRTTLGENTRLFSVGVGSSTNRYLIEGLAEEGRGYATYVGLDQDPKTAVQDIYDKINNPYLVNISIDWGDLEVTDVYPGEIRDLYDGEPLVVVGRYDEPGRDEITITGTVAGRPWEQTMSVRLVSRGGSEAADRLWARSKIHHLNLLMLDAPYSGKPVDGLVEQIIGTSLDYAVLSEYTAFVAVDAYVRTDGSAPEVIGIPLNMPEGVSYDGIFGATGQAYGGVVSRSSAAAPVYMNGGGGYAVGNMTEACCDCEEFDDADYYYEPVYTASLGGISDYLGARPSVFRELLLDAVDLLNESSDILQPGVLRLVLTLDGNGVITSMEVSEDTVEVAAVIETLESFLVGETVPGASAGRVTVTINI